MFRISDSTQKSLVLTLMTSLVSSGVKKPDTPITVNGFQVPSGSCKHLRIRTLPGQRSCTCCVQIVPRSYELACIMQRGKEFEMRYLSSTHFRSSHLNHDDVSVTRSGFKIILTQEKHISPSNIY